MKSTKSPLLSIFSGDLARLKKLSRRQPVSEDLSTRADKLRARMSAEVERQDEENSLLSLLLAETVRLLGQLAAGGVKTRKARVRQPHPRPSVPIMGGDKSRTRGAETNSPSAGSRPRQEEPSGNRGARQECPASIPLSLLVARKHCGKCWVTHLPLPRYLS